MRWFNPDPVVLLAVIVLFAVFALLLICKVRWPKYNSVFDWIAGIIYFGILLGSPVIMLLIAWLHG